MAVMLNHAIGIDAKARFSFGRRLQAGPDMHPGRVPPEKEGFIGCFGPFHKVDGRGGYLLVDGLHPFPCQRPGILDVSVGG